MCILSPHDMVQAWVGQNVSLCNVCETIFFAPPCVADGQRDAGRRGQTMASAAVSSHGDLASGAAMRLSIKAGRALDAQEAVPHLFGEGRPSNAD